MPGTIKRCEEAAERVPGYRKLRETVEIFLEIDAEQRAASFAYYALFSMVPLLALLLTLGSVFFTHAEIHRAIEEFVPLGYPEQRMLWGMVTELQQARGSISAISILILSWTSLRFFQALVRAVNRAWHTVENPWWQTSLKNLAMIAVIGGGLLLGIVVPAIVQAVGKVLVAFESFLAGLFPTGELLKLVSAANLSRFIVGGVILFYTFVMLYKLAPRRRVAFRQVWMPALIVSLSLQALQVAFVNYLPRIINYNAVYGTVGGLMFLLMWVYISGMLIIAGGCMCAAGNRDHPEPGAKVLTASS